MEWRRELEALIDLDLGLQSHKSLLRGGNR
jgi:hypothetical protein